MTEPDGANNFFDPDVIKELRAEFEKLDAATIEENYDAFVKRVTDMDEAQAKLFRMAFVSMPMVVSGEQLLTLRLALAHAEENDCEGCGDMLAEFTTLAILALVEFTKSELGFTS